jgi:hypothetical protein
MSSDLFPTSRDNYSRSPDGFVEWAKSRMTRGIRALEEHAEEIGQIGVEAARAEIEASGRINPAHNAEKDGPVSMIDGVHSSINKSRTEGQLSIRVGWDLTQYRDGYPELQDKGFTPRNSSEPVEGMQALAYGKMMMKEAVLKVLREANQ